MEDGYNCTILEARRCSLLPCQSTSFYTAETFTVAPSSPPSTAFLIIAPLCFFSAILLANANLLDNRIRFVLGNNAAALQRRNAASVRFAGKAVQGLGDFTTEFLTYSGKLSGASHWSDLVYLG